MKTNIYFQKMFETFSFCFYCFSTGLEFTISPNIGNLADPRAHCGVLVCKESGFGIRENGSRTVTNMTLFRTTTAGPGNTGGSEQVQPRRLASVSPTQPNLQQVYDGMKLYGVLKDGQATLRVELSKQADCLADYICELREVDASGKEMVTSSRLVQRVARSTATAQDSAVTSTIVMRLSSFMERLDVKLETMEARYTELKKDLMEKLYSLEDKTLSGYRDLDDKLCDLESKLSAIDSEAIQEKVLKTIKIQIDSHFEKVASSYEKTDDTLNKTATIFTSLSSNNTIFQNNIMENYNNFFDNVTRGINELFTRNRNMTETMEVNFISFKDEVDVSWQGLEFTMNKSVANTLSALNNITSELNSSLVSNMKSALTDFFMPEGCKKNTPVLLHPVSTPYPVIYRSEFPGLDTPILCDTITDGGGWIVIQRRSTGTVDFYRNWASYREGFGTLDNDFWLGNEKIHTITSSGEYELRVELKKTSQSKFALYSRFSLAGEDDNYAITVGSYSGTAGNSLAYHNGQSFSTYDRDNDKYSSNCAKSHTGAWWYNSCYHSNLNGKWKSLGWNGFSTPEFSEMKIRRKDA